MDRYFRNLRDSGVVIVRLDLLDLFQEIPRIEPVSVDVRNTEGLLSLILIQLLLQIQIRQIVLYIQSFQWHPRRTWQCIHSGSLLSKNVFLFSHIFFYFSTKVLPKIFNSHLIKGNFLRNDFRNNTFMLMLNHGWYPFSVTCMERLFETRPH